MSGGPHAGCRAGTAIRPELARAGPPAEISVHKKSAASTPLAFRPLCQADSPRPCPCAGRAAPAAGVRSAVHRSPRSCPRPSRTGFSSADGADERTACTPSWSNKSEPWSAAHCAAECPSMPYRRGLALARHLWTATPRGADSGPQRRLISVGMHASHAAAPATAVLRTLRAACRMIVRMAPASNQMLDGPALPHPGATLGAVGRAPLGVLIRGQPR